MGIVDEGPTFTDRFEEIERRFDAIDAQLARMWDEEAEFGRLLGADVRNVMKALGFILAGAVGKGGTKGDIEKLIADLGFKPPSNLLVGVR